MDHLNEQMQAQCERLIRVTPELLRAYANQLEGMAKHGVLPDQVIRLPVMRDLALIYEPKITRHEIAAQPSILSEG